MPETFSAKQVANRIGTDPKTLRKFLRSPSSPYEAVGQGKRYEFPKEDLGAIKEAFTNWQAKNKARTQTKPPTPLNSSAAKPVVDDDFVVEENDEEPTDEDLAELEGLDLDLDIEED
jgi:hypothetical protein